MQTTRRTATKNNTITIRKAATRETADHLYNRDKWTADTLSMTDRSTISVRGEGVDEMRVRFTAKAEK